MVEKLASLENIYPRLPTHPDITGQRCNGSGSIPGKIREEGEGTVAYCADVACEGRFILITVSGGNRNGTRYWSRKGTEDV